jgi:hypothetical protein
MKEEFKKILKNYVLKYQNLQGELGTVIGEPTDNLTDKGELSGDLSYYKDLSWLGSLKNSFNSLFIKDKTYTILEKTNDGVRQNVGRSVYSVFNSFFGGSNINKGSQVRTFGSPTDPNDIGTTNTYTIGGSKFDGSIGSNNSGEAAGDIITDFNGASINKTTLNKYGIDSDNKTKAETIEIPKNYNDSINKYASKYGIDPNIIRAVICVESGWNPDALSFDGQHGKGLMQIDDRFHDFAKTQDVFNTDKNIEYGTKLLSDYIKEFDGDVESGIGAYNSGPGNITSTWKNPEYLKKVFTAYSVYSQKYIVNNKLNSNANAVSGEKDMIPGGSLKIDDQSNVINTMNFLGIKMPINSNKDTNRMNYFNYMG